ncbi:hypothetical protein CEXT_401901 [Caerostris extrusa]|uniref:LAGLIDADG homing endonuclease n=1 Tax=Caerostris extrusa TaxID=172846 RepID=A0AAV4TBB9_CAEEX|nr:hypothetical protein CEXT_401901 [Caerostris extrusa]
MKFAIFQLLRGPFEGESGYSFYDRYAEFNLTKKARTKLGCFLSRSRFHNKSFTGKLTNLNVILQVPNKASSECRKKEKVPFDHTDKVPALQKREFFPLPPFWKRVSNWNPPRLAPSRSCKRGTPFTKCQRRQRGIHQMS